MKSTIRVDFEMSQFETRELLPVIRVNVDLTSDDTRDSLLREFVSQLGYESNWLTCYFGVQCMDKKELVIKAIPPRLLEQEMESIKLRLENLNKTHVGQ